MKEIYIKGLEKKLNREVSREDLKNDMLMNEYLEGAIRGVRTRTVLFELRIGKHIAVERYSFHELEDFRQAYYLK